MAFDPNQLKQELRSFIYETYFFGDDSEKFEDPDSFMEKGILDSTGVLELTPFMEEKYELAVEDDEMVPANLDSIDNLVAYIQRKKG